jgi:hypothetical protein
VIEKPLTDEEVAELDGYGPLRMFGPMKTRAAELWEREILYGRVTPDPLAFDGLVEIVPR